MFCIYLLDSKAKIIYRRLVRENVEHRIEISSLGPRGHMLRDRRPIAAVGRLRFSLIAALSDISAAGCSHDVIKMLRRVTLVLALIAASAAGLDICDERVCKCNGMSRVTCECRQADEVYDNIRVKTLIAFVGRFTDVYTMRLICCDTAGVTFACVRCERSSGSLKLFNITHSHITAIEIHFKNIYSFNYMKIQTQTFS